MAKLLWHDVGAGRWNVLHEDVNNLLEKVYYVGDFSYICILRDCCILMQK